MIAQKMQTLLGEALKAKDEVRLSTLRMLSSAFNYEKINKQHELTQDEEIEVIKREAKKRRDAIDAYKKANAPSRAAAEEAELKILEEFLPEQLTDDDLEKIVTDTIQKTGAKEIKEMGKIIGIVMGQTKGQADGGRVSAIVKSKLT